MAIDFHGRVGSKSRGLDEPQADGAHPRLAVVHSQPSLSHFDDSLAGQRSRLVAGSLHQRTAHGQHGQSVSEL